jgi:hypothetical protein
VPCRQRDEICQLTIRHVDRIAMPSRCARVGARTTEVRGSTPCKADYPCTAARDAVADAVKTEFSLELPRQRVAMYDPTKQAGARLSERYWIAFEQARETDQTSRPAVRPQCGPARHPRRRPSTPSFLPRGSSRATPPDPDASGHPPPLSPPPSSGLDGKTVGAFSVQGPIPWHP